MNTIESTPSEMTPTCRIGFSWGSSSPHHHWGFGLQGPIRNRGEFCKLHNLLNCKMETFLAKKKLQRKILMLVKVLKTGEYVHCAPGSVSSLVSIVCFHLTDESTSGWFWLEPGFDGKWFLLICCWQEDGSS